MFPFLKMLDFHLLENYCTIPVLLGKTTLLLL